MAPKEQPARDKGIASHGTVEEAGSNRVRANHKAHLEMLSPTSTVLHDVRLPGRESGIERQIDVLIEDTVAEHKIRVVVDCKNWGTGSSVPDVGSFASLVKDVGAHKGVMLSKKGYSEPALPYARNLGIDLCQLHNTGSRNWKVDLKVPIVVEELCISVGAKCRIVLAGPPHYPTSWMQPFRGRRSRQYSKKSSVSAKRTAPLHQGQTERFSRSFGFNCCGVRAR